MKSQNKTLWNSKPDSKPIEKPRLRQRRLVRWALFILVGMLLLALPQLVTDSTVISSYVAHVMFENNFHAVVPGRVFRSGEMSNESLARLIDENKIATILDLRLSGARPEDTGLTEEDVAKAKGVVYRHIPLQSSRVPEPWRMNCLIEEIQKAQTPVLIHCSSGTHRTGVAAGIWLMLREGGTLNQALDQLNLRYGFLLWERKLKGWWEGKPTLDYLLFQYAKDTQTRPEAYIPWTKTNLYAKEVGTHIFQSPYDHEPESLTEMIFFGSSLGTKHYYGSCNVDSAMSLNSSPDEKSEAPVSYTHRE